MTASIPTSLYWHDYETWGADPHRDRPAQFAGVRTDLELNESGRPLVAYCSPADDVLPSPEACLITGITPQRARRDGSSEAEFFAAVHEELARPGTCALGYNTLRFDDEVTRFGFWRNFYDPYAREWQGGNSRWDLIDTVRLMHALRPEGIEWPQREDGTTSFRLEDLTTANGIAHVGAHDALADVRATIALARLIRAQQPKLYDYAFTHRDKGSAGTLLDLRSRPAVLHVSRRYPARIGCIAPIMALARHPSNSNQVIVCDLRHDPTPLLTLDAAAIRRLVYTRTEDLGEGEERIPLKTVHLNKCPVLAPLTTLTGVAAERWSIDRAMIERHRAAVLAAADLPAKLAQVFGENPYGPASDPDFSLYDGLIADDDRRRCEQVRRTAPERLGGLNARFSDPRLGELFFRYRARNWPETLTREERARWEAMRRARLSNEACGLTLAQYRWKIAQLAIDPVLTPAKRAVLSELADWPAEIGF